MPKCVLECTIWRVNSENFLGENPQTPSFKKDCVIDLQLPQFASTRVQKCPIFRPKMVSKLCSDCTIWKVNVQNFPGEDPHTPLSHTILLSCITPWCAFIQYICMCVTLLSTTNRNRNQCWCNAANAPAKVSLLPILRPWSLCIHPHS